MQRASAQFMRDFLKRAPAPSPIQPEPSHTQLPKDPNQPEVLENDSKPICMGYDSDLESDDELLGDNSEWHRLPVGFLQEF